jgi:hypothetical protein
MLHQPFWSSHSARYDLQSPGGSFLLGNWKSDATHVERMGGTFLGKLFGRLLRQNPNMVTDILMNAKEKFL